MKPKAQKQETHATRFLCFFFVFFPVTGVVLPLFARRIETSLNRTVRVIRKSVPH